MTAPTIGEIRRALERAQSGLTAPTDAPSLTTERARTLARRWADSYTQTPTQVEQLFAWVRARFESLRAEHPYMVGTEYERGWLLCHLWGDCGLRLVDAEALCEAAGWPS